MARYLWSLFPAAVVLCALDCPSAQAQLFGSRNVGRPINSPFQRQSGQGAAGGVGQLNSDLSDVGILSGNERFLRGNRSRRDFVGSDRNEQSGFVGSQQALGTGRVRSATEGLRIETTRPERINRALPPQPADGPYYPRLSVEMPSPETLQERAMKSAATSGQPTMIQRLKRVAGPEANLEIRGRTAILTGRARSERQAQLAAQILGFEPGVDQVQNKLIVASERR